MIVVFKAMGFESDQEAIQLVGAEEDTLATMAPCLEECQKAKVYTQIQVRRTDTHIEKTHVYTHRRQTHMHIHT